MGSHLDSNCFRNNISWHRDNFPSSIRGNLRTRSRKSDFRGRQRTSHCNQRLIRPAPLEIRWSTQWITSDSCIFSIAFIPAADEMTLGYLCETLSRVTRESAEHTDLGTLLPFRHEHYSDRREGNIASRKKRNFGCH